MQTTSELQNLLPDVGAMHTNNVNEKVLQVFCFQSYHAKL